jgi:trans-aconitate methyltransferase
VTFRTGKPERAGEVRAHEWKDAENGRELLAELDLSNWNEPPWAIETAAVNGAFEDLCHQFNGRDDEPIIGSSAEQFAREGETHTERYAFLVEWLQAEIGSSSPRLIVDAGAGPAFLTSQVAARWPESRVMAIDLSPDMVRLATDRFSAVGIDVVHADVRRMADISPPADAIVSRRMIHRVDDIEAVAEKVMRSLRPGGTFINYSFRRPTSDREIDAFLAAAKQREHEPDLYAAFVRAVLNAPTAAEYARLLASVMTKQGVREAKLRLYPFDIGLVVTR